MKLKDSIVLVTGANRGMGLEFARQALAAGARKVYAAAREPANVTLPGVVPVQLDVTDAAQVTRAATVCADVTLVVNNAGAAYLGRLLQEDSMESLRAMFDTNVLGIWRMSQAFSPVLAANGGGAFLNVLSVVSWFTPSGMGAYAATKAAAWNLTNAIRGELHAQGTQVLGLHVGLVDTDLAHGIDAPKLAPATVVERAYVALEQDRSEVLIDELSHQVKQGLSAEPGFYLAAGTAQD